MRAPRAWSAVAAAIPLLAFGPVTPRPAANHWALIIGVSDYINFEGVQGGDLPGAEHDATAMRDVLVARWGFPAENVHLLLNKDATRAAIVQQLTGWLKTSVHDGDQVVVYFAGHGSQVWDGPPTPDHPLLVDGDEDDGLDETIAPADVLPNSDKNDIIDDELGVWLRDIPSKDVVFIHDNCNAGTGTRDVNPFSEARKLPRDVNKLSGPRPSRRGIENVDDKSGFADAKNDNVLEIAAAMPDQAAVDAYFPGTEGTEAFHGGAFTTFLVQQLWRAPANTTYEQVFRSVSESMKLNRFQQSPMLSENLALAKTSLFGAAGGGAGFIPVVSATGAKAELGAGEAVGITPGSMLLTENGAVLVVDGVTRDRATVKVTKGSVAPGAKATLVAYRQLTAPLRVNVAGVDTETAAAVKKALAGTSRVALVEQADGYADLFLRRRGTEVRIYGLDGFPRKSFASGAADAAQIASALTGEAAAKRLGDLDNLGQTFGVRVFLDNDKTGFGLGETIRIHAQSERAGYLTVVDLGTDDKVTVLFPNTYHKDNKIAANAPFTFPTEDMGFEIQAQEPAGRGMVRAFVTPVPLDLPTDDQGFVTGDVPLADKIGAALAKAAGAAQGAAPDAINLASWGTASLVYDIKR